MGSIEQTPFHGVIRQPAQAPLEKEKAIKEKSIKGV